METANQGTVTPEEMEKVSVGIREMVQFGESKNGVLAAANLAILYNVAGKVISFSSPLHAVLSVLALVLFAVSTLILFYSMFPKLKFSKSVNPLFFGSIHQMKQEDYVNLCETMTEAELVRHYAAHIHVNSGFALRKFRDFKYAAAFAAPSYVIFAVLYFI
ncbi:MAG TPA: DUF5706 domain-containing protein [Candidatus Syntrophosphaera sp.]|jgi:hypothetical protein|nr:DUF5706 domain-containing protein [Candidatus Syntrophosphaera sp.]